MSLIANYTEPRARIYALIDAGCATRVVFLEGIENIGKSYLLENLRPQINPAARLSVLDLFKRRAIATPFEILSEISINIGREHFPKMLLAMASVQHRPITATVSDVSIKGSYNTVNASAQESEDDRLLAAMPFTDGFLADLAAIADELHPLVLAFDAYEAASQLVDRWFYSFLVPGLCKIAHIRLIISARQVPKEIKDRANSMGTGTLDVLLSGVNDAAEWLPVVTGLKRRVPAPEGYLMGVVAALKGVPGEVMAHLMTLPADP